MDRSFSASLPFASQDWANTKSAYRFFANQRVSEAPILSGHFAATRERVRASDGPVLVLQDTTEFTFQRERREAVGITRRVNSGLDKASQLQTSRGEPPVASLSRTLRSLAFSPLAGMCSAAIWMMVRIASPEMLPAVGSLPHLICSRRGFGSGGGR